jgi:hypothetical protein
VFDLKISGIAAGAAFVLSFLLGLASGAAFSAVLIRALVFGLVFFVLSSGCYFLVTRFLPDLLDGAGDSGARGTAPGSLVNIALNDGEESGQPVVPGAAGDDLDDISGMMGDPSVPAPGDPEESREEPPGGGDAGMDQGDQNGYTERGLDEDNPFGELLMPSLIGASAPSPRGAASPGLAGTEDGPPERGTGGAGGAADALPEMAAMAGAFHSLDDGEDEPVEKAQARRVASGGKAAKLEGNFDPKEVAAAIRTKLKRE